MSREMPVQLQVSAGVPRFFNCQSLTLFLDLWLEAVLLLGTDNEMLLCVLHVPKYFSAHFFGNYG